MMKMKKKVTLKVSNEGTVPVINKIGLIRDVDAAPETIQFLCINTRISH